MEEPSRRYLIFSVAQFLQDAGQWALISRRFLIPTDGVVHLWRSTVSHCPNTETQGEGREGQPADKNLDVSFLGHRCFEKFFCNVSRTTLPFRRWMIEDVEDSELLRVLVFQLCEFMSQEDIIFGNLPTCQPSSKPKGDEEEAKRTLRVVLHCHRPRRF